MKLAIISDSHDNVPNIDEALKLIADFGAEVIIHCGDVCAPSVLAYLAEKFSGPIYLCLGNVEGDHQKKITENQIENVTIFPTTGIVELDKLKIAFNHYPDQAKKLAEENKYDLVFYGHNHKPWEETVGTTRLVNPGTLAGLFSKPTMAFYDTMTKQLTLKILYT